MILHSLTHLYKPKIQNKLNKILEIAQVLSPNVLEATPSFQSIPAWNEIIHVWSLAAGRNDVVLLMEFRGSVCDINMVWVYDFLNWIQNWKPWNRSQMGLVSWWFESSIIRPEGYLVYFVWSGLNILAAFRRFRTVKSSAKWHGTPQWPPTLCFTAHDGVRFYTLFLLFEAQRRSHSERHSLNLAMLGYQCISRWTEGLSNFLGFTKCWIELPC